MNLHGLINRIRGGAGEIGNQSGLLVGDGVDQIVDTSSQYQAALEEAGYQDGLAAFQAQYDEWKAENGSETTDESVEEESSSVAE